MIYDNQFEDDGIYQTAIFPQADSPLNSIPQFLTASMLGNQPIDPQILQNGSLSKGFYPSNFQIQAENLLSDEKELKYLAEIQQLKYRLIVLNYLKNFQQNQKQEFEQIIRTKTQQTEQINQEIQRQLKQQIFESQIYNEINKTRYEAQSLQIFKDKDQKIQLLQQLNEQLNQEFIQLNQQNQELTNKLKNIKQQKNMADMQTLSDKQEKNNFGQLEQLQQENQNLKKAVSNSEELIKFQREQIQNLQQTNKKVQENQPNDIAVKERDQKIQEINEQLQKTNRDLLKEQSQKDNQYIQLRDLQQQLQDRDSQIQELKQNNKKLGELVSKIPNADFSQAQEDQLRDLQYEKSTQKEEIFKLQQIKDALEQEINHLRIYSTEVAKENYGLQEKVRNLHEDLIKIEAQNADHEKLQKKIKESEIANQELRKLNDEKDQKISQLNQQIKNVKTSNGLKGEIQPSIFKNDVSSPNQASIKNAGFEKGKTKIVSKSVKPLKDSDYPIKRLVQQADSQVKQIQQKYSPLKLTKQENQNNYQKQTSETPQFPSNQPEEEKINRQIQSQGKVDVTTNLKKKQSEQTQNVIQNHKIPQNNKQNQPPKQIASTGMNNENPFSKKKQPNETDLQNKIKQSFTFADSKHLNLQKGYTDTINERSQVSYRDQQFLINQ